MEYEINSCGYDIVFDSATIDTTIGEETIIEVEQAINYIKSGEQEIKNYVDNVSKPELDNHVETVNKAEVSRYITEEKQPEIDEYIDNYINTESKPELNNYLQNDIKPALQVFANEKTLEFDNNAQTKQALVDASAQAAANSEITAIEKANSASQSASEAKTSEDNAKISETNAKASENSCKDILERLGTVIKIKGRVDSIENLPTSGNLNGDVYLVGAEGLESYPEYYWFDDHWEFIGTSSNKMEWGTLQGTLSNQTDLQQALDDKASLTKNQTHSGTNAYNKPIYLIQGNNDKLFLKDTRVDVASETGTDTFNTIIFQDSNGFNYGTVAINDQADGSKRIRISVTNKLTDGTTKSDQIWVRVKKDGTIDTYAPTPTDSSNDTNIAVTSWVRKLFAKLDLNNVFTADQKIAKSVPVFALDATGGAYGEIQTRKAGVRTGGFRNIEDTNGAKRTCMYVASKDGTTVKGEIGVCFDGTNIYTMAPTPATADNSTTIATTAWFRNNMQVVTALPSNPTAGVFYFVKE